MSPRNDGPKVSVHAAGVQARMEAAAAAFDQRQAAKAKTPAKAPAKGKAPAKPKAAPKRTAAPKTAAPKRRGGAGRRSGGSAFWRWLGTCVLLGVKEARAARRGRGRGRGSAGNTSTKPQQQRRRRLTLPGTIRTTGGMSGKGGGGGGGGGQREGRPMNHASPWADGGTPWAPLGTPVATGSFDDSMTNAEAFEPGQFDDSMTNDVDAGGGDASGAAAGAV